MLNSIKGYQLKSNITKEKLIEVGFNKDNNFQKFNYFRNLIDDIELHIEIETNPIEFDDFDNVLVLDSSFGQPYTPFYTAKISFEYLDKVIKNYNIQMDKLVNKGVLDYKNIKGAINYEYPYRM